MGVCYADLDHFKEFNDRYGYACGDGVIRLLSRILRDTVRGLAPGRVRGAHWWRRLHLQRTHGVLGGDVRRDHLPFRRADPVPVHPRRPPRGLFSWQGPSRQRAPRSAHVLVDWGRDQSVPDIRSSRYDQ
ncbi:MAG: diguanylate cyclase [Gemmatimonadota bacterium]|nr:diguanylate cyclase [Gemmatimonadota bacterium]